MQIIRGDVWKKLIRAEAVTLQKGRCHYCRCRITMKTATADHKKPVKRGGMTTRENIVAACEPCNRAKGSLPEGQFFKLIKREFPHGESSEIILIWATRRIWKRANRACKRIEIATSLPPDFSAIEATAVSR